MIPLRDSAAEEPASNLEPPGLIVGRDDENHWVVVDTHGLCGGVFVTEAAAVRYAREESRGRRGAVLSVSEPLALNIGEAAGAAPKFTRS